MSTSARDWAQHQIVTPASAKLLLLVLSDHEHHQTKRIFPSLERIEAFTSLNRKTIIIAKRRLQLLGILQETDERVGRTQQIKAYRINREWGGPWIDNRGRVHPATRDFSYLDQPNDPDFGPVEVGGKSTEIGTGKSPDFGTAKEYRNRDTEPSNRGNLVEGERTPMIPKGDEHTGGDLFGQSEEETGLSAYVLERWNQLAAHRPAIAKVMVLNANRIKKIDARGKEGAKVAGSPKKAWDQVFAAIDASTYLCGEDPPSKHYAEPFAAWLDFVLRQTEFTRILEGGYRANRSAETHDAISGRRFGPAEQAGRAKDASIRAAFDQRRKGFDDRGGAAADGSGDNSPRPARSAFDQYRTDAVG